MTLQDTRHFTGGDCAERLRVGALVAFIVSVPLFSLVPSIDTAISGLFFRPGLGFDRGNGNIEALRSAFKFLYVVTCAVTIFGFAYTRLKAGRRLFGLTGPQHLFLILCLSVGPGLVTNIAMKDHWGRARPREIAAFGGDKAFTPALLPAEECKRNCSFVCGEASSVFMIFFASALLLPRWSAALIGLGIAGGLAAGAVRIAQGGHFLSDVIFAGILMAVTAAALHFLLRWLAPELAKRMAGHS